MKPFALEGAILNAREGVSSKCALTAGEGCQKRCDNRDNQDCTALRSAGSCGVEQENPGNHRDEQATSDTGNCGSPNIGLPNSRCFEDSGSLVVFQQTGILHHCPVTSAILPP